jgi:hypothetical protein
MNLKKQRVIYHAFMRGKFLGAVFSKMWLRKSRRYGSNVTFKLKNHVRKAITLFASHTNKELRANKIFKQFCKSVIKQLKIKSKF